MKLLLDTHILIWALNDDSRLSKKARNLILNPRNVVYYSSVSVWEVSIKHALHPENVSFGAKELTTYCKDAGFSPLELREEHVFALETLARPDDAPKHNDPFDRALVAQAKTENMTFLTHDSLIPLYQEDCVVWV